MFVKISRFLLIKRGGEVSDFFTSPQIMFSKTFKFKIYLFFLLISNNYIFFYNILVIFENLCNIDFATFSRFLKFLATFFCNIYVAKNVFLQHFLMLQKKMPMLEKKNLWLHREVLVGRGEYFRVIFLAWKILPLNLF